MFVQVSGKGFEPSSELRDHVEETISTALDRFTGRIARVNVFLADENGPKNGLDKSIRLVIDIERHPLIVSERLKGASARRFKRGQFDRKGMVHSDSGFLRKPSTGVGTWYVVWIWTKRRELSSYSLQG